MARNMQVTISDDLDGGPADETVLFALDGISYEIDLNTTNAKELRHELSAYVEVARRTGRGRPTTASKKRETQTRAREIRSWAKDHGYQDVAERGRIRADVVRAYDAAAGDEEAPVGIGVRLEADHGGTPKTGW